MSEHLSSKDLLPCPFCGKDAKVYGVNLVGCVDTVGCGAQVDWGHFYGPDPVIAAWNKRAAGIAEVENLRRENVRWENAHKILLAENERLRKQVGELSIHAEKWVKRALGGDRASVFSQPTVDSEAFVVTAGQVTEYAQPPSRYTIEPHGDGHALYFGRDHMHHGFNLARITEATPEALRLLEQALNAGAAPEPPAEWKLIGVKRRSEDGRSEYMWWDTPPEGTSIYACLPPPPGDGQR